MSGGGDNFLQGPPRCLLAVRDHIETKIDAGWLRRHA
jgi:hypothetical protein